MRNQEKTSNQFITQKQKRIFILCDKIPVELGGLGRIVLNKAQLFAEEGHDVTILTILLDNDSDLIQKELKKRGQLTSAVNLINIYNYYKNKNTQKESIKSKFIRETSIDGETSINEPGYQISFEYKTKRITRYFRDGKYIKYKKWRKDGSLEFVDYFDESNIRIKRKHYQDGFLTKEIPYENHKVRSIRYFTKDGFCYLNEQYNHQGKIESYFLFDRSGNDVITFNNINDFHKHFLTELCESSEERPYLICDGSGPIPTIANIDPEIAYRISQLHSNMRDIGVLKHIEKNDAFITLTERQRKDIIKEFGDYGNTYVIPNFVLNEELNLEKLEKKPNKISIFTRLSQEKNLEDAVRAFKLVVDQRKNARLEIFGRVRFPGEIKELKKIKKLIKELQLENNVFIKGYVANVYEEMAESIATILTSRFEGFPMAVLESMFNSTPVVSYDINYGPSDIITHGIDGFLVEDRNIEQMATYILELLDDIKKSKEMGAAAKEKILKNYTEDIVIPEWEKLFETLSNENKTKSGFKDQLVQTEIQFEKSNNLIKEKEIVKKRNEKEIKELNFQINDLKARFYEMEYITNRSFTSKMISKFPSFYILFNAKNNGLKNAIVNIKGYKVIKKNRLLDHGYYLKNNADVRLSGMDPILHYMFHGFKEGRKPNPTFDGDDYLKNHTDVKNSKLNPLVHYSLYGINEKR